ncbi:MAG: hypothetical protein CBB71_13715 [Rhodopirellula sp. TMED11]|nr:MAG: hypothetical protein CBB71_13715 [Rhodopirellula sp. TMED11]
MDSVPIAAMTALHQRPQRPAIPDSFGNKARLTRRSTKAIQTNSTAAKPAGFARAESARETRSLRFVQPKIDPRNTAPGSVKHEH